MCAFQGVWALQQDGRSISQEHFLVEYARRLEDDASGRIALHIHLSKLRQENRRPFHGRVVSDLLRPLCDRHQGQVFTIGSGDLVVALHNATLSSADDVLDRLRYLFAEDPLSEINRASESGQLVTVFDLETDYRRFRALVERLYGEAKQQVADAANKGAPESNIRPMGPDHLVPLLRAIQGADISAFLRRQAICVVVPGNTPQPVFWEVKADIDEIGRKLMPGLDLTADRWLRILLREALTDRLLVWFAHREFKPESDPLSLDATVDGLLSDQFLALDHHLLPAAKKRLILEFQEIDIFTALGATVFVRHYLQERGYRLCLDGLNHMTLPMIDRTKLEFDFLKLHWGPDFETDIRSERSSALRSAIAAAGASRVILYHCDSARALSCGQSFGITLFQGTYVDSMLKARSEPGRAPGAQAS